jgi:hypothetical protein
MLHAGWCARSVYTSKHYKGKHRTSFKNAEYKNTNPRRRREESVFLLGTQLAAAKQIPL